MVKKKEEQEGNLVRVNFLCPKTLRSKYKALMAIRGVTMQDDLLAYICSVVEAHEAETSQKKDQPR